MAKGAELLNWIDDLPLNVRDAVLAEMKGVKAPDKTLLFERHTPSKGLYRIISGQVRSFTLTAEGRELVYKIYSPPENFGELAAIDGGPHPTFAETIGACELLFLSSEALTRLRAKHLVIETALLRCVAQMARSSLYFVEDIATSTLKARVAARLAFIYAGAKARGEDPREVKISQKDIASMVGSSRQSINKALTELQELGLIETRYSAIRILNPRGLSNLGRNDTVEEQG